MKKIDTKEDEEGGSASELIDAKIKAMSDWRGETLGV